MKPINYYLWKQKDDDTTLLFSDSPETVEQDGILYQDTVKGDTRLLYYHLNGMKEDKKNSCSYSEYV